MIVTDKEEWAERAKYLTTQAKDDPVEYVHNEIGYNYRLTNLQAAMGVAQLEQLDGYIAAKRRIAGTYTDAFDDVRGITPMAEAAWAESIFWMYSVLVDEARYGESSRALLRRLREARVQSRPLWQPLHTSAAHQAVTACSCEHAEQIHSAALSLPCSVGLTKVSQNRVTQAIRNCLGKRPSSLPG